MPRNGTTEICLNKNQKVLHNAIEDVTDKKFSLFLRKPKESGVEYLFWKFLAVLRGNIGLHAARHSAGAAWNRARCARTLATEESNQVKSNQFICSFPHPLGCLQSACSQTAGCHKA